MSYPWHKLGTEHSSLELGIKEASVFQRRVGELPEMASSQEKATSGVLRSAAALLDEMQLMGEAQGECFRYRCCCFLMQNFALVRRI